MLPSSSVPWGVVQAQRLTSLEEENERLKAAGRSRGQVLKQSRAVIDSYLARSAALSSKTVRDTRCCIHR